MKKITIILLIISFITGYCLCYIKYKDMILPKTSNIDTTITKLYPEAELLKYISAIGNYTIEEVSENFDIEYMQETEDRTKCYVVFKSQEGGYFFMFFSKDKEEYTCFTTAYFKDYVPTAKEYVDNIKGFLDEQRKVLCKPVSQYEDVVKMYWYFPFDMAGRAMKRMEVVSRDFVYVKIYFGRDYYKNDLSPNEVAAVVTDCTYIDFVLPEDKEFIYNKFSNQTNTTQHSRSYMVDGEFLEK